MPKADRVHSTPPTNLTISATEQPLQGFAAKTFPPSIDDKANQDPVWGSVDWAARAAAERHPLTELIRLRQEAADEIERLLTFLDESDGIIGEDFIDDDEDAAVDDAPCDEDFDAEPSLGWTRTGALGNTRDLEIGQVAP